jgi:hypothetical protein
MSNKPPVLLHHDPSIRTTILIPNFDKTFPGYPVIDCGQLFRDLTPLLPEIPSLQPVQPVNTGDGLNQKHPPLDLVQKRSSRYGNIIEKMEQKYLGVTLSDSPERPVADTLSRRPRKSDADDYYDLNDDFVDDSDHLLAIESQVLMKRVQTKHSGFFVSSGDLEVLTDNEKLLQDDDEPTLKRPKTQVNAIVLEDYPGLVEAIAKYSETINSLKDVEGESLRTVLPILQTHLHALDDYALSLNLPLSLLKKTSPYIQSIRQAMCGEPTNPYLSLYLLEYRIKNARKLLEERADALSERIRSKILPIVSSDSIIGTVEEEAGDEQVIL